MIILIDQSNEHMDRRFDRLERMLMAVIQQGRITLMSLDQIQVKVQENTDVQAGAVELLGDLSELIRANAQDPVKLVAIADQLDSNKTALAAAIVENTPAVE